MNTHNQILTAVHIANLGRHAAAVSRALRKPFRCLRFLLSNSPQVTGLALAAATALLPGTAEAQEMAEAWVQPFAGVAVAVDATDNVIVANSGYRTIKYSSGGCRCGPTTTSAREHLLATSPLSRWTPAATWS